MQEQGLESTTPTHVTTPKTKLSKRDQRRQNFQHLTVAKTIGRPCRAFGTPVSVQLPRLCTCSICVHCHTCHSTDCGAQLSQQCTASRVLTAYCAIVFVNDGTDSRTLSPSKHSYQDFTLCPEPLLGASSSWSSGVTARAQRSDAGSRLLLTARILQSTLHINIITIVS